MKLHQSYFRFSVVAGFMSLLVAYTASATEPAQPPTRLGPEELAHQLSKESMSPDALVSTMAIYEFHKKVDAKVNKRPGKKNEILAWTAAVQIALTNALGPATPEDPAYLQGLPSHDDPVARISAVRALTLFMRPQVQVTLLKGEKVLAAIRAGHVDSIVDDDLRRALVRRLARIISTKDPEYVSDQARGWAVELLGYLKNSPSDKGVEEDILYDIIMANYLEEDSYYVRNRMLDFFKDPTYLKETPGPEQFLCERITDPVITSLERTKALNFLANRPPHDVNKDLRLQALIAASRSSDPQLRSTAVFQLSGSANQPAAIKALKGRLLEDQSIYIQFLAGGAIRTQDNGQEVLSSAAPALKESLSRDEPGALFSPTFLSTIEKWANDSEEEKAEGESEISDAEPEGS